MKIRKRNLYWDYKPFHENFEIERYKYVFRKHLRIFIFCVIIEVF